MRGWLDLIFQIKKNRQRKQGLERLPELAERVPDG